MVAVKPEKSGGMKNGSGGGSSSSNNPASEKKDGTLHPALFMSNKRMMEILRCSEVELNLLKHGAAKLVRMHPKIHHRELRWELSEQEDEWEEMLSGEKWEGEDYPFPAGFEKDVEHTIIKIKSLASCALERAKKKKKKKKREKRRKALGFGSGVGFEGDGDPEDGRGRRGGRRANSGTDDDDGGGGGGGNGAAGGVGGGDGDYMMSGGLGTRTTPPAFFRKLDWLHKDHTSGGRYTTPRPSASQDKGEDDGEDLYGCSQPPQGRMQPPFIPRTFPTQATPTPASRRSHPDRMFPEEDANAGFVGVFSVLSKHRNLTS